MKTPSWLERFRPGHQEVQIFVVCNAHLQPQVACANEDGVREILAQLKDKPQRPRVFKIPMK